MEKVSRYKPVGWKYESYRHSLASKGIRTSFIGKKSQIVNKNYKSNLFKSGVPTSQGLNRAFKDTDNQEDLQRLRDAVEMRRRAKEQVEMDLIADRQYPDYMLMDANEEPIEEFGEEVGRYSNEYGDEVTIRKIDSTDVDKFLKRRLKYHKRFASKETFGEGVKEVLLDPVGDLSADWKSYKEISGQEYKEPETSYEKAQNVGASLVGRVVTMQNVEPLIDYEKDRSWRDAIIDVQFGRDR